MKVLSDDIKAFEKKLKKKNAKLYIRPKDECLCQIMMRFDQEGRNSDIRDMKFRHEIQDRSWFEDRSIMTISSKHIYPQRWREEYYWGEKDNNTGKYYIEHPSESDIYYRLKANGIY